MSIVLSHPVRTAIGAYNGALKRCAPPSWAIVVRETLRRASTRPLHSPSNWTSRALDFAFDGQLRA